MAKVVFCNIAWMKFYSGISDNDQPKNGGAFVKENNDACESFNFYPYNHYCLGYVRAPGERLNLARVEDVPDDVDKIESGKINSVVSLFDFLVKYARNFS